MLQYANGKLRELREAEQAVEKSIGTEEDILQLVFTQICKHAYMFQLWVSLKFMLVFFFLPLLDNVLLYGHVCIGTHGLAEVLACTFLPLRNLFPDYIGGNWPCFKSHACMHVHASGISMSMLCTPQYEICVESLKCVQQHLADKGVQRMHADVTQRLQGKAIKIKSLKARSNLVSDIDAQFIFRSSHLSNIAFIFSIVQMGASWAGRWDVG